MMTPMIPPIPLPLGQSLITGPGPLPGTVPRPPSSGPGTGDGMSTGCGRGVTATGTSIGAGAEGAVTGDGAGCGAGSGTAAAVGVTRTFGGVRSTCGVRCGAAGRGRDRYGRVAFGEGTDGSCSRAETVLLVGPEGAKVNPSDEAASAKSLARSSLATARLL